MSNVAIYWVATSNINGYNQYTSKSKIDYCNRWGYKYFQYNSLDRSRHPAWSHLLACKDIFEKNPNIDIALKIDADAMIMNHTISIESIVDGIGEDIHKYHFVIAKDINGINSGVHITTRQPDVINVLDELYNNPKTINHHWWEQGALMDYYEKHPEKFLIVPQKLFNCYTEHHAKAGVSLECIFSPGDFIVHSPGGDGFLNRQKYFSEQINHIIK